MEIKEIQRRERRPIALSIKTSEEASKWMNKNNASPTAIFNNAVKELMKKVKKDK